MTTLNGRTPKDSYMELLKINSSNMSTSLVGVETGDGIHTPFALSSTQVSLNGIVWPTSGAAPNKVLALDSSGQVATWVNALEVSPGTVSSVGMSLPNDFILDTSTITSTGVFGVTRASQTSKTFLAAPANSNGVPSYRTITALDIPVLNQNTTGSAATLATPHTIGMTGDVLWTSAGFDGSQNVTGVSTLVDTTVTAGSYGSASKTTMITVDSKGRLTNALETDIQIDWAQISNVPTSLVDYGITDAIPSSEKGAPNGVAVLGPDSKVLAIHLPSYVDDVLEFDDLASFPASGETGKIYVALDTNKTYRWSGSTYIYITSGAVDSVAGKTGVVTLVKADVGLGNVDNTSDANKPISTATQTALDLKAPINNPSFTGTVTGITRSMVGLSNVDNTSDFNKPLSSATQTALTLKAPLDSPIFTGTPSAPTAILGTNSTQLASTAFVIAQLANDAAPISHVGSGGSNHALATSSTAGFMSSTDKIKLDGLSTSGGTVSSVGLAAPTEFTVTNSPVTGSGTLTFTKNSQSANTVWAAPNGASGAPTFRALVAADIPTLNQNTTGNAGTVTNGVYLTASQNVSNKALSVTVINDYVRFLQQYNFGVASSGNAFVNFALGQKQFITLAANTNLSFSFPGVGSYQLIISQDGTGNRTVTWPAGTKFVGSATAPSLNTVGSGETVISIFYNGSSPYIQASKVNA